MQGELATTLANLKVVKGAFNATFDPHKRYSSIVQARRIAVQELMNFTLRNDVQTVFDQVRPSTKAYKRSVECDISSLRTASTQNPRIMWARFTDRLDTVHRDVLDLVEVLSS